MTLPIGGLPSTPLPSCHPTARAILAFSLVLSPFWFSSLLFIYFFMLLSKLPLTSFLVARTSMWRRNHHCHKWTVHDLLRSLVALRVLPPHPPLGCLPSPHFIPSCRTSQNSKQYRLWLNPPSHSNLANVNHRRERPCDSLCGGWDLVGIWDPNKCLKKKHHLELSDSHWMLSIRFCNLQNVHTGLI